MITAGLPSPQGRGSEGAFASRRFEVRSEAPDSRLEPEDGQIHSQARPVAFADTPFNKPVLPQANVGQVMAGISIEDLARTLAGAPSCKA